jgi:hypothetical protein
LGVGELGISTKTCFGSTADLKRQCLEGVESRRKLVELQPVNIVRALLVLACRTSTGPRFRVGRSCAGKGK